MGPELMMNFAHKPNDLAQSSSPRRSPALISPLARSRWVRETEYHADSVIVSTGARSLMLGLEEEQRLIGHGLSTCATCDGFFFRDQHIAVVGGGDSAIEEALPHEICIKSHLDSPAMNSEPQKSCKIVPLRTRRSMCCGITQ